MVELSNGVRRGRRATRCWALLALPALFVLVSCKATTEANEMPNEPSSGNPPAGVGGAGATGGVGGAGGTDFAFGGAGGGKGDGTLTLPDTLKCAENDQSLLIIDLRSGWWHGDGGDYHTVVLDHLFKTADPATNAPCNNISIEYHYFIQGYTNKCNYAPGTSPVCQSGSLPDALDINQFVGYFDKPFSEFTQVWILSGSQLDPADLNITATFFVDFVELIADHCMPMLLAADDCFIDHGNIISQAMGMGPAFQHSQGYCPMFVGVSAAEAASNTAATTMDAGTHLSDHILFTDVSSVADGVQGSYGMMGNPTGDSLQPLDGVKMIATNTSNNPQIGEAFVSLPGEKYPRPVILDAGWDRSWTVAGHEGTATYMRNLVLYMGLIGCIAEEYVPK